ncbi:MAG: accessory Sec system translocase SecA2 [Planctomycetia bacterium]|nr:accessory Sec system translocase SecA2 [Planctomycetia bacterium]
MIAVETLGSSRGELRLRRDADHNVNSTDTITESDIDALPSRRFAFWRNTARVRDPSRQEMKLVRHTRHRAAELERVSDRELRDLAAALRESSEQIGPTISADQRAAQQVGGAALVREAVRRVRGLKYYGEQLLAGLVLASGHVAEMATGEGKTIVAAIPAFLSWINGWQTHIATPNSYLSQRDCKQIQPALEMLGVRVSLLPERNELSGKKKAYQADVVYGTGYEFGFDYLRDQLTLRNEPLGSLGSELLDALSGRVRAVTPILQTHRDFTVIDEVDSVLIDEAMTPLILSAGDDGLALPTPYLSARSLAAELVRGEHFHLDVPNRQVRLTDAGRSHVFHWLERHPIDELRRPWDCYVVNALQAKFIFEQGVDYVVRNGEVQIVDQKTGRIFGERTWRDGLHQAIEAFAGTAITNERSSAARITRQRFYQLYPLICGMTGTAETADEEFESIYRLKTVLIPRHRPCRRVDLPDRFFATKDSKFRAIVGEIMERHRCGQPVLVGTRTIGDSHVLSTLLDSIRMPHQVLNGLQDADEAEVIARAGQYRAITVATNMAGRGTDIKPDERALAVGGLFVIGVERNEARRVDRQLAGRAGRQGDLGFSRFFVSADDDLLQRFAPKLGKKFCRSAGKDGEVHDNYGPLITTLQHAAESDAFRVRRKMVEHDRWLDDILANVMGEAE